MLNEKAVIGSMLIDPSCIDFVAEKIQKKHFSEEKHQKLYSDIIELHEKETPIDTVTLKNKGNDALDIIEVMESVPHAASVEYYCDLLLEQYNDARLKFIAAKIQGVCKDEKTYNEKLTEVKELISNVENSDDAKKDILHIADIAFDLEGKTSVHYPTQFKKLNDYCMGFKPGDFVIVAARPGMGKTSLMLNFVSHFGLSKKMGVSFFSLEMQLEQLKERLICGHCEVPAKSIKEQSLTQKDKDTLQEGEDHYKKSNISLSKTAGLTPRKLRQKIAYCKRVFNTQIVFVDYLQLMRSEVKGTMYETTSDISRKLKEIAVDCEVPIIVGSQLNRKVEQRDSKRPQLCDFRDSGAIEEDADLILSLYRESYYTNTSDTDKPLTELTILKGREFGTGTIDIDFMPEITKFVERSIF